jgi:hypothetical protein
MKRIESITFYVSTSYIPALINGDFSGLETSEIQTVEDFHNDAHSQCPEGFEWGHFSVSDAEPDFRECEASEKLADCVEVSAIFWNKKA